MANTSLADDIVSALSEVKRIGEMVDNDHPMRHSVRGMKRAAEQILVDAARQAADLAYQSRQLIKDYDESVKGGA